MSIVSRAQSRFLAVADRSPFWADARATHARVIFLGTGWGKLHGLDKVTGSSRSSAFLSGLQRGPASTAEFVCGALLWCLLSRLARSR